MVGANTKIGVMPMGIKSGELSASHNVTITRDGVAIQSNDFKLTPVRKAMPAGMWGEPKLKAQYGKNYLEPVDLNGPRFVENALAGFEVRPGKPPEAGATHWIDPDLLHDEGDLVPDAFSWQAFASTDLQGKAAWQAAVNTIVRNPKRAELLSALGVSIAEFDFGESVFDEVWVEA